MSINTGFKGSIVSITDMKVIGKGSAGPVVSYTALFSDADGTVHGTVRHEVAAGEDPAFVEAIKKLHDACKRHAENAHFTSPSTPTVRQALQRGISEALSGSSDSADDPGEEG
jgi:hypothetical protein